MTPSVVVLVPWRTSPERAILCDRVMPFWASLGYRIDLVDDGGTEFSRAASLNVGARRAIEDVLILADADTLPDLDAIKVAIEASSDGALHTPYDVLMLGNAEGGYDRWDNSIGGLSVIARDAYAAVGGFDVRFRGWGFEDIEFAARCSRTLGPSVRHAGTAWSLYHTPSWRHGDAAYQRNRALLNEIAGM